MIAKRRRNLIIGIALGSAFIATVVVSTILVSQLCAMQFVIVEEKESGPGGLRI